MHYEIAGESNSALLSAVVSGVPAGLRISEEAIDADVARWSSRMRALSGEGQNSDCEDHVNVLSGVADGRTTGAPIVLVANNAARRPGSELQNMPLERSINWSLLMPLRFTSPREVSIQQ